METKTVTFDFFRVQVEGTTLDTILNETFAEDEEERNEMIRGHVYRLQELQKRGSLMVGEMLRLRMDDAALKARASGGPPDLVPLLEDEGLAEETAFAFHPKLKVLALQRHKFGTSPWTLSGYLEQASGFSPIVFEPILEKGALQKLAKMNDIRAFDFQVAGANQEIYDGLGLGMKELGRLANRTGAPQVRLRMSMGHATGSMAGDAVKTLARALFDRAAVGEVTRIRITGRDPSGELEPLDLLRHRMVEFAEIELDGKRMPHVKRAAALRQAFEHRNDELIEMFEGLP